MATVVLQTAGAAIGGAIGGPIGSVIGQALGAAAGAAIDQSLFGPKGQTIEGPRLDQVRYMASAEGNPVARLYGTSRLAGEIIWATRFKEVISKKKVGGGKGGAPKSTVTEYAYYGSFAIGLCEGEIGGIGRIWADGAEVKKTSLTMRIYRGTEEQMPDALIETKQGANNAPAFRGTAYVVFENFPLERYGNRIPQISVEVIKPVGELENSVKAVNMIPGASEFAYDIYPVSERRGQLSSKSLNVHQLEAGTDFLASLDMLQATCPNLEQISLVVAWFGDDLRAGHCQIRPKVEFNARSLTRGEDWYSGGLVRSQAQVVSRIDGRPALGGTPSDGSVIRAIREIRSRGLRVGITPFLMMDIPASNGLSDPFGGSEQGAYPWRGRIIASAGEHTRLAANRNEVQSFVGSIQASAISVSQRLAGTGAPTEWSYRRMILHYARLAQVAGGVDQFLIGSEMRGLTSVRDQNDDFPFVEALVALANDVRPLLGSDCVVSYAADWSEYFHYKPNDGSEDLFYNLDPLWASSNINAVAIDNYFPLADFDPLNPGSYQGRSSSDTKVMKDAVEGGEGFDWFYASSADREARIRTPITDGLGKEWTFRFKDVRNWIQNQHFDRRSGIEVSTPSPWVPNSKPIMFAELGAPAVHNAASRPNVFPDPKSSENALPYFSNSGRDDFAQAAYLNAFFSHWDEGHADYISGTNPNLGTSEKRLVDMSRCQLWAWDARPYPAFPALLDVWSDGENWARGHWLNGRLGRLRVSDLILELLKSAGVHDVNAQQVYGIVDGFVLAQSASPRQALEALIKAFQITVSEENGTLVFRSLGQDGVRFITQDEFVLIKDQPAVTIGRAQKDDIPTSASLFHLDRSKNYQTAETSIEINFRKTLNRQTFNLPITTGSGELSPVLESWLEAQETGRDTVRFLLSNQNAGLTVGDLIQIEGIEGEKIWRLVELTEGEFLECVAQRVRIQTEPRGGEFAPVIESSTALQNDLVIRFLDLPLLPFENLQEGNRIAASSLPWNGPMAVYVALDGATYSYQMSVPAPATQGVTASDLAASAKSGRWLPQASLTIELFDGELSSANRLSVFNGSNALAIGDNEVGWEIVQFQSAEPLGNGVWRLANLLRGQAGTDDLAGIGKPQGTQVVVLDAAIEGLVGSAEQIGREIAFRVGPAGENLASEAFAEAIYTPGHRSLIPWRPVHLRRDFSDPQKFAVSWNRRDRTPPDNWSFIDVPMSENIEAYEVSVSTVDAEQKWTVNQPKFSIEKSQLQGWLGTGEQELTVRVAQISAAIGPGIETQITSTLTL